MARPTRLGKNGEDGRHDPEKCQTPVRKALHFHHNRLYHYRADYYLFFLWEKGKKKTKMLEE